jgi:hypothetical protein
MAPRGVRNNHPGNIDRTATAWQGEDRSAEARARESRFAVFDTPASGFRALAKTLQTYQAKYSLGTVRGIINRWAPPTENNTSAYVTQVAKALGVEPDRQIDVRAPQTAFQLLKAVAAHENGGDFWDDQVIWDGLALAGVRR